MTPSIRLLFTTPNKTSEKSPYKNLRLESNHRYQRINNVLPNIRDNVSAALVQPWTKTTE